MSAHETQHPRKIIQCFVVWGSGDSNGRVSIQFTDHLIKLRGNEANIIGRGLIVHADPDDCGKGHVPESKTTGNSGSRIACALIGYASKCNK